MKYFKYFLMAITSPLWILPLFILIGLLYLTEDPEGFERG